MKKIVLLVSSVLLLSCSEDDCGCVTPPTIEEKLRITLVNEHNENLLLESTDNYLSDNSLDFYVLVGNKIESLTQTYGNSNFIIEEVTEKQLTKNIILGYVRSPLLGDSPNEILYIINYKGQYSNDTIFMKYHSQAKAVSDKLIEVKLNGVDKNLETKFYENLPYKELIIVK